MLPDIVPISIPDVIPIPSDPVQPETSSHELYKLRSLHEPDPAQTSVPDTIIVSVGDIRIEFGSNVPDDTILRLIKVARYA